MNLMSSFKSKAPNFPANLNRSNREGMATSNAVRHSKPSQTLLPINPSSDESFDGNCARVYDVEELIAAAFAAAHLFKK